MARFKKYLLESEEFADPRKIECPFIGHLVSDISSKKQTFKFFTMKHLFSDEYASRINQGYSEFSPTGIVPLICCYDMKVFMWDADNNTTHAPETEDEINFCNEFIRVMKSPESLEKNANNFDFDKIAILSKEESKLKK